MTRLLPIHLFRFCLFLFLCIILQGCSAAKTSKSGVKVGMHFDAVLEFIVEYPLSWSKERRLTYGSKEGEVRWTHPDHPNASLTIKSAFQKRRDLNNEQQIDQALHEYVGLEVLTTEEVALPAGDAWHITGHTAGVNVNSYLLLHSDRIYLIVLTAPPETIEDYQNLMIRVTQSFQALPE